MPKNIPAYFPEVYGIQAKITSALEMSRILRKKSNKNWFSMVQMGGIIIIFLLALQTQFRAKMSSFLNWNNMIKCTMKHQSTSISPDQLFTDELGKRKIQINEIKLIRDYLDLNLR